MLIKLINTPKVILSNPYNKEHEYFGWPSIARLQNEKIAVVASGFRQAHICPFGKAVISYSENDGETYTLPAPVIDTSLDDRDAGILAFGDTGVIVTSFNNSIQRQREWARDWANDSKYRHGYLDLISKEDEKRFLGATYRISRDCGVTFGDVQISPVTSPHGPCLLKDGTILWVGTEYPQGKLAVYTIDPVSEKMEYVGEIEKIDGAESCEPYAIELDDGRILCHIRSSGGSADFTLFQSVSCDRGRTWSKPRSLMPAHEGAPAHIIRHSSGVLVSVYGYRGNPDISKAMPYSIRAMFSEDDGATWDTGYEIYSYDKPRGDWADIGYPASLELDDGSILTVFYARTDNDHMPVILQQKWKFEK